VTTEEEVTEIETEIDNIISMSIQSIRKRRADKSRMAVEIVKINTLKGKIAVIRLLRIRTRQSSLHKSSKKLMIKNLRRLLLRTSKVIIMNSMEKSLLVLSILSPTSSSNQLMEREEQKSSIIS
jgi:hypothetical protein